MYLGRERRGLRRPSSSAEPACLGQSLCTRGNDVAKVLSSDCWSARLPNSQNVIIYHSLNQEKGNLNTD